MANEAHVWGVIHTKRAPSGVEEAIAALASRQHGVVSRAQLLDLGLGADAIKHRVALGRLHPMYRGVYAVGHTALRSEAWWLAATLAAGPGAALSYRSAAELWGVRSGSTGAHRRQRAASPAEPRAARGARRRDAPRRSDRRRRHPGHHAGAHAAGPRRRRLAAAPEGGVRRGRGPPPHEPDLPRCPRGALPRATRDPSGTTHPRQPPQERRGDPDEHPRAPLADPPRCQRSSETTRQPAKRRRRARRTWQQQRLIVECDGFATHGTREA